MTDFLSSQPIGIYPGKYQWAGKPSLGDCSLEVREANITFDDGEWECQVTSSSFASQDALASKPARLVVRGESRRVLRTILRSAYSQHVSSRINLQGE